MPKPMTNILLSSLLGILLAGCEVPDELYIYREGGTVSRADNDIFECRVKSAQQVPTNTQINTTPIYTTPAYTNCYGTGYNVQCYSTGGQVYGRNTYSYDANANLRTKYLARCLASRGYSASSLPACNNSKIPSDLMAQLGGRLRTPTEGSCYVSFTENAGNIVYASELLQ